jgi:uncharacterized membrane protein
MQFQSEYFWFCAVSLGLIAVCITLPYLAASLLMYRIYGLLLLFLSPFCIIGIQAILKEGSKLRLAWLDSRGILTLALAIVLIPYFLFNSGFIFEITERSGNMRLHAAGETVAHKDFHWSYFTTFPVPEQDVAACKWMTGKMTSDPVYVDTSRRAEVVGYGLILRTKELTPSTPADSQIYLGYQNVTEGTATQLDPARQHSSITYDLTQFSPPLSERSKLYTNGGSDVYR